MLDELGKIDWSRLGYPKMPSWLNNLLSEDKSVRDATYDDLYDNQVDHLSDASPHVIPFLIELLSYDEVQQKEEILRLLMRLASEATAYFRNQQYSDIARTVLDEITAETEAYLPYVDKQATKLVTIDLLGYLKQKAELIIPKLMWLPDEKEAKVATIYSLDSLLANNDTISDNHKYIEYFGKLIASDEDFAVRTLASIAIINLTKENAPREAEAIVVQLFSTSSTQNRLSMPSIYNLRDGLLQLGVDRAIGALLKVLSSLTFPADVFHVIPALLNLGFNNGKVLNYSITTRTSERITKEINFRNLDSRNSISRPIGLLNEAQKQILTTIVENDAAWAYQTNIFALHGLPSSREEMGKLLTRYL